MSKVLIIKSDYKSCKDAIETVFEYFPLEIRGKKVAVKVNALKAGDPEIYAYTTNYNILKAVIDKLETFNPSQIVVGDSVGTESYGNSEYVFEKSKLKEYAKQYYRNFNHNLVTVDLNKPFKRKVAVLKDVIDADIYISLPKMKTHGLTMISGAIKNNFGLLTGAQKSWYHYHSIDPKIFAEIIIEMYKLRQPDLVIMDAIVAMEGYGPASSECRSVNKIIASNDGVALETVQAKIIGFEVEEIPVLSLARNMNLGETFIENIELIGDALTISDYHRPEVPKSTFSYKAGVGSGSTSIEYYRNRVAMRPVFNNEKCETTCFECVNGCPFFALEKKKSIPQLDVSKCMLCNRCKEVCCYDAVELLPNQNILEELEKKEKETHQL